MSTTDTIHTFNYNIVAADAIAHSVLITPQLKEQVKSLLMAEQTEVMSSVLRRLNSDADGRDWEMVRREPSILVVMLLEAHTQRLEELLLSRKEDKENNDH